MKPRQRETSRRLPLSPPPVADAKSGFTLVEAITCTALIGLLIVASLNAVGLSRHAQQITADQERGHLLAHELMAEILQQAYVDSEAGPGSFGLAVSEYTGNRSLFDDVDDYYKWTASPPQERDGTVMTDLAGWRRTVNVVWFNPYTQAPSNADTGVKQITVTVTVHDRKVATLVALRTSAWPLDGVD